MTTEQRAAFNRAAHIYAEAAGVPPAEAVSRLEKDHGIVRAVAQSLRDMAGVSPLADELDLLFAVPVTTPDEEPTE